MKKNIIYSLIAFILGYIANNLSSTIVKPAYAYCECNEYDFNFSSSDIYDFDSAVKSILSSYSFSHYDIDDFRSGVENIIEGCSADEYGDISC